MDKEITVCPHCGESVEVLEKDCYNCNNLFENKECLTSPILCGAARKLWVLKRGMAV